MATYGSLPSSAFKGPLILPRPSNSAVPLRSLGPMSSSSSSSPAAAAGRSRALKVHSQAEKRRRERINEHLSTLRRMVPSDTAKVSFCMPLLILRCSTKSLQIKFLLIKMDRNMQWQFTTIGHYIHGQKSKIVAKVVNAFPNCKIITQSYMCIIQILVSSDFISEDLMLSFDLTNRCNGNHEYGNISL